MCPSLVEIRSVTSKIKRRKNEEKKKEGTTAIPSASLRHRDAGWAKNRN